MHIKVLNHIFNKSFMDKSNLFAQAIKGNATEIFPVGEGHGWRLGRLCDPFGLHWEIGHQLLQKWF